MIVSLDLTPTKISKGNIEFIDMDRKYQIIRGREKLSKDDLVDLATLAREKKWYDRAIGFLQEATK